MTDSFESLGVQTKNEEALLAILKASTAPISIDTLRRKLRCTKSQAIAAVEQLAEAHDELRYEEEDGDVIWDADQTDEQIDAAEMAGSGAGSYDVDKDDPDYDAVIAGAPLDYYGDAEDDASEAEDSDDDSTRKFRFPDHKKVEYEEKGGNCGDQLAQALTAYLNTSTIVPRKDGKGNRTIKGIDLHALREVADVNGVTVVRGANPGQMRMNLSNTLRAKWRKGASIFVGETVVRGLVGFKSRAAWIAEYAAAYVTETKCTRAVALAQAEQEFEVRAEAGEYDPYTGEFRHG